MSADSWRICTAPRPRQTHEIAGTVLQHATAGLRPRAPVANQSHVPAFLVRAMRSRSTVTAKQRRRTPRDESGNEEHKLSKPMRSHQACASVRPTCQPARRSPVAASRGPLSATVLSHMPHQARPATAPASSRPPVPSHVRLQSMPCTADPMHDPVHAACHVEISYTALGAHALLERAQTADAGGGRYGGGAWNARHAIHF